MESENSSGNEDLMPTLLPVEGKPMPYDVNNEPKNANDYLRTGYKFFYLNIKKSSGKQNIFQK